MTLFILGLALGFSVGLMLLALLSKSKESDFDACRVIEQAPSMVEENLLISR